jgi:hypothetical protein
MNEKSASYVRHSLDVSKVSPVKTEGCQNVPQGMVEIASLSEVSEVSECSVQICIYYLDVLFELGKLIMVFVVGPDSCKQRFIQKWCYSQEISYEERPYLSSDLDWDASLKSILKFGFLF